MTRTYLFRTCCSQRISAHHAWQHGVTNNPRFGTATAPHSSSGPEFSQELQEVASTASSLLWLKAGSGEGAGPSQDLRENVQ